jgi:L-alanine-DL-glutamate epimerase-like enolase superfamily enzyme
MTVAHVAVDHYRIPLPVVLSDSTHGDIAEFELVTVRLRDATGAEGVGYTYTVGKGGAAVTALIERDLSSLIVGAEPDRIEGLWQRMWWALHYGGRGGYASLAITSHGAHEVTVQLLAAVPNRSYLEVHGFGLERYLKHPFELSEGFATAPERPGHGVEFDWRELENMRADR